MRTVLVSVLAAFFILTVAPSRAVASDSSDSKESSDNKSIKDEFKEVGHAFKNGGRAVGHIFKKSAKAVGKAIDDANDDRKSKKKSER